MKKILSLLGSVTLTAPLLVSVASCGNSNTVTIGFSRGNDGEYQAFRKVMDKFIENNPDITVKERQFTDYTKEMTAMIAAGNVPDVVIVPPYNLNQLLTGGVLKPLDFIDTTKFNYSLIEPFTAKFENNIVTQIGSGELRDTDATDDSKFIFDVDGKTVEIEPTISQAEIQDTGFDVYAIPKDASTLASFINNDAENDFGLNALNYYENSTEVTYNDLFENSKHDTNGFTVAENPLISRDLGMLGLIGETRNEQLLDELISNKNYLATLWGNKYKYLNEKSFDKQDNTKNNGTFNMSQIESGSWTGSIFASEKADVVLEGNWAIANTELSRSSETFKIKPLPKAKKYKFEGNEVVLDGNENHSVSMSYTNGWGLTRNAGKNAEKLIEYLVNEDGNGIWTTETKMISANIDVLKSQETMYNEDERLKTFLAETSNSTSEQTGSFYVALMLEWENWMPTFYIANANTKTFDDFYTSISDLIQRVKQNLNNQ